MTSHFDRLQARLWLQQTRRENDALYARREAATAWSKVIRRAVATFNGELPHEYPIRCIDAWLLEENQRVFCMYLFQPSVDYLAIPRVEGLHLAPMGQIPHNSTIGKVATYGPLSHGNSFAAADEAAAWIGLRYFAESGSFVGSNAPVLEVVKELARLFLWKRTVAHNDDGSGDPKSFLLEDASDLVVRGP